MAIFITLLRVFLPLLILIIILRFVLPRFLRTRQQQSDRIDVDATVVNSEQHASQDEDLKHYEPSKATTKPPDVSNKKR